MADILVPIDFSEATAAVLECASQMSLALQARIVLMHVEANSPRAPTTGYPAEIHLAGRRPADLQDQHHAPDQPFRTVHVPGENYSALHAQEQLQRHIDALRARKVSVVPMLISGKPIEKILAEAETLRPVMIVLGSHGHGVLRQLLLGSVSEGVLRKATCPVLIVPRAATAG